MSDPFGPRHHDDGAGVPAARVLHRDHPAVEALPAVADGHADPRLALRDAEAAARRERLVPAREVERVVRVRRQLREAADAELELPVPRGIAFADEERRDGAPGLADADERRRRLRGADPAASAADGV